MLAIIDYGMGNLRSVQKGFEKVGHEAVVTSDPAVVASAAKVVLPGVGAFADAMDELRARGLVRPVLAAIDAGLWVDDTPVAKDPRREMLRWAHEQAVSESRHRHGNVTPRRPGLAGWPVPARTN